MFLDSSHATADPPCSSTPVTRIFFSPLRHIVVASPLPHGLQLLVYIHKPFREEGPWQIVWGASLFMSLSTTVFLSWSWIEDLIIFPIRSHLRWRAEQRRAESGKVV